MKIKWIIFFSFILISVIPLSFFSITAYSEFENELDGHVYNKLSAIAESQSARIEESINAHYDKLDLIASRTKLRNTLKIYNETKKNEDIITMRGILNDAKNSLDSLKTISIMDLNGKVIVSTTELIEGNDYSNKNFFVQGREKKHFSITTDEYDLPIIVTSGPIFFGEEKLGVIKIESEPSELLTITKDYSGLKETGETVIAKRDIEGNALFITPLRFDSKAAFTRIVEKENTAAPITHALLKQESLFVHTIDYREKEVISVTKYIEDGDLGLVVKIDKDEAFESKNNIIEFIFISISIVLLLSIIFSFILASFISSPIKYLNKEIEKISKGDLSIVIKKSNIEEINLLTESINRILASMKLAILRTGISKTDIGIGTAIKAKHDAEEKYKVIFENAGEGIMIVDSTTWRINSVNKKACEMSEYTEDELIGSELRKLYELKEIPKVIKLIAKFKEKGELEEEMHLLTKTGKIKNTIASIRKIRIDDKDYALGIFRDIK